MDPNAIDELLAIDKEELPDAKGLDMFGEATNGEVDQGEEVEGMDEKISGLPPLL
jgi:hypothetical protein